jgi:hypothetical protein
MQDHQFSFDVNASREDIWAVYWGKKTGDVVKHNKLRIEILHSGDENGEGLIRHCQFPVPRYLLSGGTAQSWEWLTQVKPHDSWRCDAVAKPLWSQATGWTRLEALDHNHTRIHFRETYHVFNPIMRFFLEKKVHRAIAKDIRKNMQIGIEYGLRTGAHKSSANANSTAVVERWHNAGAD